MQRITQEMRQFETIFLSSITDLGATARVFTTEEELPFAGHPVLGAAAVLHRTQRPYETECNWNIDLPAGRTTVQTTRFPEYYRCEMDQGIPKFRAPATSAELRPFLARLGLQEADIDGRFSAQVVSTGLPYLIVPVHALGLAKAKIVSHDLEQCLQALGAKFVLLLDVDAKEIRTWDNQGKVEDVATGSAAGPAVAFLIQNGAVSSALATTLHQGRFAGRPSELTVRRSIGQHIHVSGNVWSVSCGHLEARHDA